MLRARSAAMLLVIYLLYSNATKSGKKPIKFEAHLENIQSCKHPNPPYAKKVTVIPKYTIQVVNGTRYLSGITLITAPTPFQNFSARTYSVDSSGKRVLKFQISNVNCRNLLARSLMRFTNIPCSTKSCMLSKGQYNYDNLDIDKITHAMLTWHAPGNLIHEMKLVANGASVVCHEVYVKITEIY